MMGPYRWLVVLAAFGAAAWTFAACTEPGLQPAIDAYGPGDPQSIASGDAGADGGSADASSASACFGEDGGCNSMALCGPENFVNEVALAAPTATGGTIVPGVYSMTSYTIYTGAGGASETLTSWFQETFQLIAPSSGDAGADAGTEADGSDDGSTTEATSQSFTWLDVTETDQGGTAAHGSGLAVQQLTSLSLNHECPSASSFPTTYTATPTSITIYFDDTGIGTAANVFQLVQ